MARVGRRVVHAAAPVAVRAVGVGAVAGRIPGAGTGFVGRRRVGTRRGRRAGAGDERQTEEQRERRARGDHRPTCTSTRRGAFPRSAGVSPRSSAAPCTFAMTCGAWMGFVMYAFAPSCRARERSSLEPSVVMMMMGTSLCVGSLRTRLTSLSPSMMGMLMSVMMMSNLPPASLRRPSTPSSASVTRRFFTRERARTRSCRIIGESSTTRQL